jgi:hypothetical protein
LNFPQVRGTPASGKSTLASLIFEHIESQEPATHVVWVDSWPVENIRYLQEIKNVMKGDWSVLVFDEVQVSYWDTGLWNSFFKRICDKQLNNRVIVFTSYGSPTRRSATPWNPMIIPLRNKVTLRAIDHHDGIKPAGLFLTRTEFDTFISLRYPPQQYKFDDAFYNDVYEMTAGHVGAAGDLIQVITAQDVCHFDNGCHALLNLMSPSHTVL